MPHTHTLPASPDYFPLAHGRYDVVAGLKPLGDKPTFELDGGYLAYMEAKQASFLDDPAKYHCREAFTPALERAIVTHAMRALVRDFPAGFSVDEGPETVFHNRLLGLEATLDMGALAVTAVRRTAPMLDGADGLYAGLPLVGLDAFTYLALQTQEDWAVTAVEPDGAGERLRALSISYPNHWRPEEKIGHDFAAVHVPVAGIAPLVKAAPSLIDMAIRKGPWERFAWGVSTDTVLNHHPDNPDDPARTLTDPSPEGAGAGTWLRIERQTLTGFAEALGALFTIRTYFTPVAAVAADGDRRAALASAIRGMSEASLAYKGLVKLKDPLLAYLGD